MEIDLQPYKIGTGDENYPEKHDAGLDHIEAVLNSGLSEIDSAVDFLTPLLMAAGYSQDLATSLLIKLGDRVACYLDLEGRWTLPQLTTDDIIAALAAVESLTADEAEIGTATVSSLTASGAIFTEISFGPEFAIIRGGRVVFAVFDDGTTLNDAVDENTRAPMRPVVNRPLRLGRNHITGSGQSLFVAGNSSYSDSLVDATDLTFDEGLDLADETTSTDWGQIPVIGGYQVLRAAAAQMKYLIEGDPEYNDDYTIVASGAGASGQQISNLDTGSATYDRLLWQISEAARLSDVDDELHQVQAFMWVQGHADANTAVATYKSLFEQMITDYRNDIKDRTGQSWAFPFIAYQPVNEQTNVAGSAEYEPRAAAALEELSRERDDVLISVSPYHLTSSDGTHMVGDSYQWLGQFMGTVLYRVIYRGEKWTGLRPREILKYRPDVILARFDVPHAPIQFKEDRVTGIANRGFVVRDDSGDPAITAVEIIADDTIRITLDRDLTTNPTLAYAWYTTAGTSAGPTTGPRGQLFDSDPTRAYQRGNSLNNPCIRFKQPIT